MDAGVALIIGTFVTLVGGVIVAFIQRGSNHSRREHAINTGILNVALTEVRGLRRDVKQDFVVVRTEIKGVVEQISEQIAEHTKINH